MIAWAGLKRVGSTAVRCGCGGGRARYVGGGGGRLAVEGIFSCAVMPLRLATLIGAALFAVAAAYGGYALSMKLLYNESPAGFTALVVLLVMLSGVQLLFLGVLGEYLGRIYRESKGRPVFVVDRVVGEDAAREDAGAAEE